MLNLVLAAWLVSVQGLSNQAALAFAQRSVGKLTVRVASRREGIAAVKKTGRNPWLR